MRISLCAMTLGALVTTPTSADAQKPSKAVQQLLAMLPADFQSRVTVQDDALDTTARLSTENGFQEKRGLLKIQWYDNFLRAFVDKKTGVTQFQVYQWITYSGDWRFYHSVNFETPRGPESKQLTVIDREVSGCSRYGCSFAEHVGFEVDESLLRKIAERANSPSQPIWRFKFGSKSGLEWQDGMSAAEVAGFLAAVDQYRVSHSLPAAVPGREIATVPASPEPPQRAKQLASDTVAGNTVPDVSKIMDLGGGVYLVPAKTKSGYCVRAPADYQGTGSIKRPSISSIRPRCTN